ncbi:MAG: FHIPEP family type III secretion protein [Candidatus Eremiobacteraeota bacterium]|nr:FHIPEP family type III secretion protein [Candidatus Eremiobacteraeota bacterium]MCW5871814.1 FHIPEP family type III secretion protein [Candidatus Eremiobacteraeota bacterium]
MKVFWLLLVAVMALWWLPAPVLDALLVFNLSLSVGVVLLAMHTHQPAKSTAFPRLLLVTTLLRLALNLAATRLLWCGKTGWLIPAFGQAVLAERVWLGALLWLVLLWVQLLVIPRGVSRASMVSARYTLDALPGKQMAVDADLHAGVMDVETARWRHREIKRDADFYTSMEGLGGFVRGECYATAALMLINLFKSGLLLCLGNAVIASVCAGLAALAKGLMITRAAVQANLGAEFCESRLNGGFLAGAAGLIFFVELIRVCGAAALPAPAFFVLTGLLHLGLKALRSERKALLEDQLFWGEADGRIVLEVKQPQVQGLLEQLPVLRRELAEELGFLLPAVRIQLGCGPYRICFYGHEVGRGPGPDPIVHLRRLARCQAGLLANLDELLKQVDLRGLPQGRARQVLRNLLEEGVSIRGLQSILDCMAERPGEEVAAMSERVRLHLSRQRYKQVTGVLEVLVLDHLDERMLDRLEDGGVLLTSANLRPHWRQLTRARFPRLQVVTPPELTGTAVAFRRFKE